MTASECYVSISKTTTLYQQKTLISTKQNGYQINMFCLACIGFRFFGSTKYLFGPQVLYFSPFRSSFSRVLKRRSSAIPKSGGSAVKVGCWVCKPSCFLAGWDQVGYKLQSLILRSFSAYSSRCFKSNKYTYCSSFIDNKKYSVLIFPSPATDEQQYAKPKENVQSKYDKPKQ